MVYLFPFLVFALGVLFRLLMGRRYRQHDRAMDIGEVLFAIILVYGFVPGVGFALMESGFGVVNDSRIYDGYLLEQLQYVQTLFLLFAGSFAIFYSFFRKPVGGKIDHSFQTARLVGPVIAAAVALTAALGLVTAIWGADVGDDYISGYTQLRNAPIIIQQFAGIGTQILLALTIAAVSFAVASWPTRHIYVAFALIANMAFAVVAGGSRTNAFLAFLAYIIAASIYVPAFRVRRAALLAVPALILFLLAGLFRAGESDFDIFSFFFSSEFTAVFVTPLDLHIRFPEGFSGQAPFNIYTVDLFRFIPSQFLPFEKADPTAWYVGTFYQAYSALGGGFAFGVMAEIVLGQGMPEAIARGAVLGSIFAMLANRLHMPTSSPLKIVAYVWLFAISYQCYRDTTFSIAARAFFHLSPVLIFIAILHASRKSTSASGIPRAA